MTIYPNLAEKFVLWANGQEDWFHCFNLQRSENMRKRILGFVPGTLICAAILCAAPAAPVFAAEYAPWAEDAVNALNEVYGNDGSGPFTADDTPVTTEAAIALFNELKPGEAPGLIFAGSGDGYAMRGQVCDAIWGMLDGLLALPEGVPLKVFDDTEADAEGIGSLAALGIVNGRGDGKFYPNDGINNAELAIIVQRTFNKLGGVYIARDLIKGSGNFEGFTGFEDVPPSHWAYDGVMYLRGMGIIHGVSNTIFAPEEQNNRYEFAALILKTANVQAGKSGDSYTPPSTGDVSVPADVAAYVAGDAENGWVVDGVLHALNGGYMTLDANGNFNGGRLYTREEMALASVKLYESYKPSLVNPNVLDRFTDGDTVAAAYKEAMAYLVSIGAFHGTPEGQLMPAESMSRAEMGVFLARVLQGIDKSKMIDYGTAVAEALNSGEGGLE
jgi:hypothetical protein